MDMYVYVCIYGLQFWGGRTTRGGSQFFQRSEVPGARRHVATQGTVPAQIAARTRDAVGGTEGASGKARSLMDAQFGDPRRASHVAERCREGPAQANCRELHRAAAARRRALFGAAPREGAVHTHAASKRAPRAVALERHAICNTVQMRAVCCKYAHLSE